MNFVTALNYRGSRFTVSFIDVLRKLHVRDLYFLFALFDVVVQKHCVHVNIFCNERVYRALQSARITLVRLLAVGD